MTEIPRKPTFPSYMVQKLRQKIQSDVEEDVIPVSTGIYSYQKLKNKLEAIPKPDIQNYEDSKCLCNKEIFFEIIEDRLGVVDKTGEKCNSCDQDYNMKKNPPVMCNFCGFWSCNNCMPSRKRPHPFSKDGSGKRYNVCQRCDTKYLNLQLGHGYVQNRTLLQQAITKTSEQLQALMNECQQYQETLTKSKQTFEKNKFKISQLRKEKLELTKEIKTKMPEEIKLAEQKQEELKVNFVNVHLKHKEWIEFNQLKRKANQEKQRQRKQKMQQQEQQRLRLLEKEKLRKQQEQQQMEKIERRQRQYQRQKLQRQQQEKQQLQRLKLQQEEENFQSNLKMKKTPSLQQNSTFSLNLTYSNTELEKNKSNHQYGGYDNSRREESEQEDEAIRSRKATRTSMERNQQRENNHNSSIDKLSPQQKQQQTDLPITQQQQQFSDYFRQSSDHLSYTKQPHYNSEYETPVKQMYSLNDSTTVNNNESSYMNQLSEKIKDNEEEVNNFSFNSKGIAINVIDNKEEEQDHWNNTKENNETKNYSTRSHEQQQYTFSNNLANNYANDMQSQAQEIPITSSKSHFPEQEQDQNNKLSFVDQWYVNRPEKNNSNNDSNGYLGTTLKQNSYLSATLSSTNFQKSKKTQQQLEEECTKSTSQLDQEQLQVARYSLIKAARDSAVQQRQRNKIYQKSIYQTDQAPYDQEEAEGVGQIKKCQCTIY